MIYILEHYGARDKDPVTNVVSRVKLAMEMVLNDEPLLVICKPEDGVEPHMPLVPTRPPQGKWCDAIQGSVGP